MKKITFCLGVIILFGIFSPLHAATLPPAPDQTSTTVVPDEYYRAKVLTILEQGQEDVDGQQQYHQKIAAQILTAPETGKKITIDHGGLFAITESQKVAVGDVVVLTKTIQANGEGLYYIIDQDRMSGLAITTFIFFALAIFFGRKRGFTSIIGLLITILIIFYGIIPHIAHGGSTLWTSIVGALVILITSLYLSHGFNKRTTIALASSLIALVFAIGIDLAFVHIAHVNGTGAEEAMYLQTDNSGLDLRGLLLGAIILGVLGVLDDVTTGQTAAIEEIYKANPAVPRLQLYKSGMSVGREHIASLINTLVLAYVGASFPLLLLFTTQKNLPLWVILNGNFIAEEIVRTLVGSTVLVVAVPLTTILAVFVYTTKKIKVSLSS